jgi:hypothetical protein
MSLIAYPGSWKAAGTEIRDPNQLACTPGV